MSLKSAMWVLAGAVVVFVSPVCAQNYPTKPIRVVVGFPPGGATDILTRILGQKLNEGLGQPVVVDNRPGAGGNIGAELVAIAPPDGYTLHVGSVGVTISPSVYPKLGYNPVKDFAPVALVASVPLIVVVHPSLPVNSIQELIQLAKSRPGRLNYASGGVGTSGHLGTELFKSMARVDITHVPYKGGGPAVAAILGGEPKIFFAGMPPALPFVKSGKLRALAVTTARRFSAVPEVPTAMEAGLPGFEVDNWHGILAPAGTPKLVVRKLNAEIVRLLKLPEVKDAFGKQGAEATGSTPEEFAVYIRAELKKWANVVKDAHIRVD